MTEYRYAPVPESTLRAIRDYVEHGYRPGGFLTAVLENDLKGACGRADSENARALFDIVAYCYNNIPSVCWGSKNRVAEWLERDREKKS